jgi:hypothetical protein
MGLYMKGNGKGKFLALPPVESGLYLGGDVKETCLLQKGPTGSRILIAAKNSDHMQAVSLKE